MKMNFAWFLVCGATLAHGDLRIADRVNRDLMPMREVIFLSDFVTAPGEAALVRIRKDSDQGGLYDELIVLEANSGTIRKGRQAAKLPDRTWDGPHGANLANLSPWAVQAEEMDCVVFHGKFVVISKREVYTQLKNYNPSAGAALVTDRLFDANAFVLVDAWRKSRKHLETNPKLLAALFDHLSGDQLDLVLQVLVEDADFSMAVLKERIESLLRERRLEASRLVRVLAASCWFGERKGEQDRSKELIKLYSGNRDSLAPEAKDVLEILRL